MDLKIKYLWNTYLADKHVFLIEMSTEHLRGFPGNGLDFDADFLTFSGAVDNFVIVFYAGDDAQLDKLQQ